MSYLLLDNPQVVQVKGPQLVKQAMLCTIQSFPSGSILIRTVPMDVFNKDGTSPLLASLSDSVEQALEAGIATAAEGVQGIDENDLIYDAVRFIVTYEQPQVPGAEVSVPVDVPVDVVTADPGISDFLAGGSTADRLSAAYQKLVAASSG